MKATLSIFAIFLLAVLVGCSEDLNLTDPLNDHNYAAAQQKPGDNMEMIWKHDELCVNISNEFIAENKAVYTNSPFLMGPYTYLVTYDSYTNAGKFTNGYEELVKISMDEQIVYEGNAVNGPVKHRLDNVRFNNLIFYIALYQVDAQNRHNERLQDVNESCFLKLTNIKVYKLN